MMDGGFGYDRTGNTSKKLANKRAGFEADYAIRLQRVQIECCDALRIIGSRDIRGLWIAETEGAKFWMGVLTELKNRRVEDILKVCMDGLSGFPDAVRAVYLRTRMQLCIVHMVRNSTRFVS